MVLKKQRAVSQPLHQPIVRRTFYLNCTFDTFFLLQAIAAIGDLMSKHYKNINDQLMKENPKPNLC